jgi:enediyne biosynthesis protein E4
MFLSLVQYPKGEYLKVFSCLILILLLGSCTKKDTLFTLLDSNETNIRFANNLSVKDTSNILDNEYFYNGGGVGIGDLNGDQLPDIYFTGNQVDNQLYLNLGNLKFEETSQISRTRKRPNTWSMGVSILDINGDQKNDIYVCNSLNPNSELNKNYFFINQGNNKNGVPIFEESAEKMGLSAPTHTNSSQFFDYDNDGDLDVFLTVNFLDVPYPNQYATKIIGKNSLTHDLLFENTGKNKEGLPVFVEVSEKAGILWPGYAHSSLIYDFNADGYLDIYVANDYLSNDLVYINNKNGTFINRAKAAFKHQSYSAMGSDLGDINNDGLLDLYTTEMMPYDVKRKRLFIASNSYNPYLLNKKYDYEYQYMRNTLQLNVGQKDKDSVSKFSEIGIMAGVWETDWSWSGLFADFDNDSFQDLWVTNGFPKDISDHDFSDYRKNANVEAERTELYKQIPEIKIPNQIFKNTGNLQFKNMLSDWGLNYDSFSNGAAMADLDLDGDIDLVCNNINAAAFVFKNNASNLFPTSHYLQLDFTEIATPIFGTEIKIFSNKKILTGTVLSNRGYLSSTEPNMHFGLGESKKVDSIVICGPGAKVVKLFNVKTNQRLKIQFLDFKNKSPEILTEPLLKEIEAASLGLSYFHEENDFIDFNFQRSLLRKYSQQGPKMVVADINNDGLEDLYLPGSSRMQGTFFIQNRNGKFSRKNWDLKEDEQKKEEETDAVFVDFDKDGDLDLYTVRGSYQHSETYSYLYNHLLALNDGKGNFFKSENIKLPNTASKCAKVINLNSDAYPDLFIGGTVRPHHFPYATPSYFLVNTFAKNKAISFQDYAANWGLRNLGIIEDALVTDINKDDKEDILLATEWEKPSILMSKKGGGFTKKTFGDAGLWTSISSLDINKDGLQDIILGNAGLNTCVQVSEKEPGELYYKDFDNNGQTEALFSLHLKDKNGSRPYIFHNRDDIGKQWPGIIQRFVSYGKYGETSTEAFFTSEELKGVNKLTLVNTKSGFWLQDKSGNFKEEAFKNMAQTAPIQGFLIEDVNKDGFKDILAVGNDFGYELLHGRVDASYGWVYLSKGKKYEAVSNRNSGFWVEGDTKDIKSIKIKNKKYVLVSQNKGYLKIFEIMPSSFQ